MHHAATSAFTPHVDATVDRAAFARAVVAGLMSQPKTLAPTWLYDRRGSELFEEITRLPEYYLTRAEIAILEARAADLAAMIGPDATLIEFGSGSSRKTPILLQALERPRLYAPLDIATDMLAASAEQLACRFPTLTIKPELADLTRDFTAIVNRLGGTRKVGFFPGSTIGNFFPREAVRFLRRAAAALGTDGLMIIGVDLQKDLDRLLAAYDDAAGVTATFNKNVLCRMNAELDGDFDLDAFRHEVRYDAQAHRVEMHLASCTDQRVRVAGRAFDFRAGETIHTENSYKYTIRSFQSLARLAGWRPLEAWLDPEGLFSLQVLKAESPDPDPEEMSDGQGSRAPDQG